MQKKHPRWHKPSSSADQHLNGHGRVSIATLSRLTDPVATVVAADKITPETYHGNSAEQLEQEKVPQPVLKVVKALVTAAKSIHLTTSPGRINRGLLDKTVELLAGCVATGHVDVKALMTRLGLTTGDVSLRDEHPGPQSLSDERDVEEVDIEVVIQRSIEIAAIEDDRRRETFKTGKPSLHEPEESSVSVDIKRELSAIREAIRRFGSRWEDDLPLVAPSSDDRSTRTWRS